MNIGKAVGIFNHIDSQEYNAQEKGEAILEVLDMPTHNGITKKAMLKVIRWLLYQAFDVREAVQDHGGPGE